MKNFNVRFHGKDFEVPDWTKYVTEDSSGIFAFQEKPILLRNLKSWSVLLGFCKKLEEPEGVVTPSCLDVNARSYFYE